MNGMKVLSDENGYATFQFKKSGTYRLEVLIDEFKNPSVRIEFGRWGEEDYETFRDIKVPTDDVIQVGLNIFHHMLAKNSWICQVSRYHLTGSLNIRSRVHKETCLPIPIINQVGFLKRIARRITGLGRD